LDQLQTHVHALHLGTQPLLLAFPLTHFPPYLRKLHVEALAHLGLPCALPAQLRDFFLQLAPSDNKLVVDLLQEGGLNFQLECLLEIARGNAPSGESLTQADLVPPPPLGLGLPRLVYENVLVLLGGEADLVDQLKPEEAIVVLREAVAMAVLGQEIVGLIGRQHALLFGQLVMRFDDELEELFLDCQEALLLCFEGSEVHGLQFLEALLKDRLIGVPIAQIKKGEKGILAGSVGHVLAELFGEGFDFQEVDNGVIVKGSLAWDFEGGAVEAEENVGEVLFLSGARVTWKSSLIWRMLLSDERVFLK
jgi:hypothetical protein